MDKHPIRTSTSMKQRHFMDEHPIRTSTSMKQRLFMDEEPIDDCLATPGSTERPLAGDAVPKSGLSIGKRPV